MEEIKEALKSLEQSVLKLEEAVHVAKKEHIHAIEELQELKSVIKTTYHRLDSALSTFKGEE